MVLTMNGRPSALELWREKLENFLAEEAIASDPEKKFQLTIQIREARQKIAELDRHADANPYYQGGGGNAKTAAPSSFGPGNSPHANSGMNWLLGFWRIIKGEPWSYRPPDPSRSWFDEFVHSWQTGRPKTFKEVTARFAWCLVLTAIVMAFFVVFVPQDLKPNSTPPQTQATPTPAPSVHYVKSSASTTQRTDAAVSGVPQHPWRNSGRLIRPDVTRQRLSYRQWHGHLRNGR